MGRPHPAWQDAHSAEFTGAAVVLVTCRCGASFSTPLFDCTGFGQFTWDDPEGWDVYVFDSHYSVHCPDCTAAANKPVDE